jgi:RNA polymerase II subunit A small phosphatase-like protein
MALREETSAYFQRLNSRLSTSQRTNGSTTASSSSAPAQQSGGTSAMLTQVQQPAKRASQTGPKSGSPKAVSATNLTAEQKVRLRRIQSQAKNLSPMNPARYAPLLPRSLPAVAGRKVLVLDVDETLVHSSYKATNHYDIHLPCSVNNSVWNIYVALRPQVRQFLDVVKDMFEVVIFTASVEIYCNPLMNEIDPSGGLGPLRLFRDHCSCVNGSYVKDLSLLGRPLDQVIIVDNSPGAYLFQPRNAIPILSWFDDPADTELMKLIPMLQQLAAAPDVYETLDLYNCQLQPAS